MLHILIWCRQELSPKEYPTPSFSIMIASISLSPLHQFQSFTYNQNQYIVTYAFLRLPFLPLFANRLFFPCDDTNRELKTEMVVRQSL